MNLEKLSAAKLEARYERLQSEASRICHALIAAGYGNERASETRARAAATGDDLAREYVTNADLVGAVVDEMNARRRWHGTLKPIKRAS